MYSPEMDPEMIRKFLGGLSNDDLAALLAKRLGKKLEQPYLAVCYLDASSIVFLVGYLNLALRHPEIKDISMSDQVAQFRDQLVSAAAQGDEYLTQLLMIGSCGDSIRPSAAIIFDSGEPMGFSVRTQSFGKFLESIQGGARDQEE